MTILRSMGDDEYGLADCCRSLIFHYYSRRPNASRYAPETH